MLWLICAVAPVDGTARIVPVSRSALKLLQGLRASVTIDWAHRDSARVRLRVLVKRILRKYGYPPDLQDGAVQEVLQQAEALSARWAA